MTENRGDRARYTFGLAQALPLVGLLCLAEGEGSVAAAPPEVVAACPQWLDVDASNLYWMSQFDDRVVQKLALADGKLAKFGKDCSIGLSGSPRSDRDSLFCVDDTWKNIARISKANGTKSTLPIAKTTLGPLVSVTDDLYFPYSLPDKKSSGVGRIAKQGGAVQTLLEVPYLISAFDADSDGPVWLDEAGTVFTLPSGAAQPKSLGKAADCASKARIAADCHVVIDSDSVYLSYEPRCGSHDACPRNAARIDRLPRKGGEWQSLASGLVMVHNMRLFADALFYSNCIGGTLNQLSKKGGAVRSITASGSCWAFALSTQEAFWFDGGTKSGWSDCRLRRAPLDSFK